MYGSDYGPLKPLEQIIEEGKTSSTYKYALLRAITDWIIENPNIEDEDDLEIPFAWIAAKFLEYYWPLIIHNQPLPQMPPQKNRGNTQLEKIFWNFIKTTEREPLIGESRGKSSRHPFYWIHLQENYLHRLTVPDRIIKLVLDVRRIVLDQPARYLPNVGGERKDIFEVRFGNLRGNEARMAAKRRNESKKDNSNGSLSEALKSDPAVIHIPWDLYHKLRDVRFCIHTSILTKWAMYIEDKASGRNWSTPTYNRLLQVHPDRDPAILKKYRTFYEQNKLADYCLLTGEPISQKWHLDHLIPWSRYPLNAFWNLVPAIAGVNLSKSNLVLEMTPDIQQRYLNHITTCLSIEDPLIEADARRGFGRPPESLHGRTIAERFSMILLDVQRTTGLKTWPK